jgi:SAM-dependent methyltransferase
MAGERVESVLDVGCSVGSIEALFHLRHPERALHVRVEGIDISAEAIRHATLLHLPHCAFRAYDGAGLPYPDDRFDLAVAIEVLEHVPDKERLLAGIYRVLKPGGRLFLTTPNPQCWALRMEEAVERLARRCLRRRMPEKDDFITLGDLSASLLLSGFQPVGSGSQPIWPRLYVSLFGWGLLPPLPPRALAWYQRAVLSLLGRWRMRGALGARLGWSTSALWEKPSAEDEGAGA